MARTPMLRQIRRLISAALRANHLRLTEAGIRERLEEDHSKLVSRRRILEGTAMMTAAAASSGALMGREAAAAPLAAGPPSPATPVVIVGAGAAGMAAAYMLKKNRVPFVLYEGANRVGGRIFTSDRFNTDGQFVELGAELVDSDHDALLGLAKEVLGPRGLQEFAGPDILEGDLFFFDGRLRSQIEFISGVRPLLAQIEADRVAIYNGLDPETTIVRADWPGSDKVREIDRLSVAEYLGRHSGLMDSWIRQALVVAYTGDMGTEVDRQSAINLVDAIDTGPDIDGFHLFGGDESMRVRGGNSRLIEALYRRVFDGRDRNATLYRGFNLQAVHENTGGSRFTLTFDARGRTQEIEAHQVILAIPATILRQIAGLDRLELDPSVKRQIAELGYGTNSKIMMSYDQRFWRQGHNGRPRNVGSLYLDLGSQNIWETSRRQEGRQGLLTNFLGGDAGLRATGETADKAQSDLAVVYGDDALRTRATKSVCWNWNTMPFIKASYSCPGPGQFTSFWGRMERIQLGGRLIFAGEHTSPSDWGFMNGAYESGIRAAHQVLESRRPARGVPARRAAG